MIASNNCIKFSVLLYFVAMGMLSVNNTRRLSGCTVQNLVTFQYGKY